MDNFSRSQIVRKPAVRAAGGIVAAQHRRAAEIGAAVLAAGGDAVDAAVATSFALGVVEPWMSGPGGGGAMVVWRAREGRAQVIEFGMRAPAALDPARYPLAGSGLSSDLFPWPAVVEDRNALGATAIAVPGVVDGMRVAHENFGGKPWRDLVMPAAELAEEGLLVDWYAALIIASAARQLAADATAAATFLEEGSWPKISPWTALAEKRVDLAPMGRSLRILAEAGPRAFYEGALARDIARQVQRLGGALSERDLASYRARLVAPRSIPYRGAVIHATPELTAGPTLADCLGALARRPLPGAGRPDGETYLAYAEALRDAYEWRLAHMGDVEGGRGGRLPATEPAGTPGCTTHFGVVDRDGNICAVTQTLLSIFGAKVMLPESGFLMNNGILWFDPEPGKPNSLAPGKRCLMNVCPVIGETAAARFALGASGGRRILPAVMQLVSFLVDHGMSLEDAFHHPRIDMSGGEAVIADATLPPATREAIAARFQVVAARRTSFPYLFACPAGVLRRGDTNEGCTEIMSPWGDAIAEAPSAAG
jgi:gamma-glutamyltranspeptidase/glutathione hydrolase